MAARHLPVATAAVDSARRLADELLFPRALDTDRSALVPPDLLDALADAGLYGLTAPPPLNPLELRSPADILEIMELLAGGCLTTAFVWAQHHRAVGAVAGTDSPAVRERWLDGLVAGRIRSGVAFSGLRRPGPPILIATPTDHGWRLDGEIPWVTGWGRIHVVYVAARREDGDIVWSLVDAVEAPSLQVTPLELASLRASGTVGVRLEGHRVTSDRVILIQSFDDWTRRDAKELRRNGSLALGVASRSLRLLGPSPLDAELADCRRALGAAMPAQRARAAELALRAASALLIKSGGRGLLLDHHAQRLVREAMFLLVSGQTAAIRAAQLERAGAI